MSNFTIELCVARMQHQGCQIPKDKMQPPVSFESAQIILRINENSSEQNILISEMYLFTLMQ